MPWVIPLKDKKGVTITNDCHRTGTHNHLVCR